jgi:fucose 4-O-acetylase-like acetyltransferase
MNPMLYLSAAIALGVSYMAASYFLLIRVYWMLPLNLMIRFAYRLVAIAALLYGSFQVWIIAGTKFAPTTYNSRLAFLGIWALFALASLIIISRCSATRLALLEDSARD